MADTQGEWLVYVIEVAHGLQTWLFWNATIESWVSDEARATRYTGHAADGTACLLSEEQGLEVKIIRAANLA